MTEYRLWITIPDLPLVDEEGWEPLIEFLEKRHGEFGPVLSWDDDGGATITLALDSDCEADAVRIGVDAIVDALRNVGLGSRYPRLVELERTLVQT